MERINVEIVMLWCAVTLCALTIYDLLATVSEIDYYLASTHEGGLHALEKRIVKKGNILEYPFGSKSRQTEKTSGCNCFKQGGEVEEKTEV